MSITSTQASILAALHRFELESRADAMQFKEDWTRVRGFYGLAKGERQATAKLVTASGAIAAGTRAEIALRR